MLVNEVLKNRVRERGIPVAELARRAGGINPDLLSKALRGEREPRANELLNVCRELDLSFDDFFDIPTTNGGDAS
jgi:transcriptional regulator with XRE-family HTH domain